VFRAAFALSLLYQAKVGKRLPLAIHPVGHIRNPNNKNLDIGPGFF
jgi:hypothetical protein